MYDKIYNILEKKYFPQYSENLEDKCCYYFYQNNLYFEDNNTIDLHHIIGKYVNDIMDSIYDFCMENYISQINIVTGNGKVLKPKVIKYLDLYNMKYEMQNSGNFKIYIY
tara:strand:- start:214 stop:543 length:330 start_codon:yes stop_codon:yes gene_type:complete